MANYDFENLLSPIDFEHLAKDIISQDLNITLTSFAEGKDGGIDLRYSHNEEKTIIVQCKRSKYITKEILEKEFDKINKLNPDSYIFVCSCNISPDRMNMIKNIFSKWMTGDSNIYTRARINDLLDKYPEIHRKNYKLWINSSTILNQIINQSLYERSKALVSDIKKSYKYYVLNPSFGEAIKILNNHKFLIISGIPGIGKSTLAKLLIWEYLQKNYEVVEIHKITEGEQLLKEDSETKQVFYFDDFLGENFLKYDVIEGRSYDLVQFVRRIMNNKHKILIMTTREYILNQAREKYDKLDTNEFNVLKYTLDLNSYTRKIRATILYNHMYYSEISIDHIRNIIKTKAYKKIIAHKNYSPRIIEQMTIKLKDTTPDEYSDRFLESLKNPFDIWNRAFRSQISEGAKYTLYLLLSIGGPIVISEFKQICESFFMNAAKPNNIEFRHIDLEIYLKELEGTFISISCGESIRNDIFINFQNPSIKDFLIEIVREDSFILKLLIESVVFFNQLDYIINYLSNNFLNDSSYKTTIASIILSKFVYMENSSRIYDKYIFNTNNLNMIDKLDSMSDYICLGHNDEVNQYLFSLYDNIDISKQKHIDFRKYFDFFFRFKDSLVAKINSILMNSLEMMSRYNDVISLFSLKEDAPKDLEVFIDENRQVIHCKLTEILDKEIKQGDESDLNELIAALEEEIEDLDILSSSEINSFTSRIDDKLEELKEEDNKKEYEDNLREYKSDHTEYFNEDELFTIELFQR